MRISIDDRIRVMLVERGWRIDKTATPNSYGELRCFIDPVTGKRLAWLDAIMREREREAKRCDSCDPSYGCFNGAAACSKYEGPPSSLTAVTIPVSPGAYAVHVGAPGEATTFDAVTPGDKTHVAFESTRVLDKTDARLPHLVEVRATAGPYVPGGHVGDWYVKLFVNGYGVATWDAAWFERRDTTAREYVEEVARVLRKALDAKRAGP